MGELIVKQKETVGLNQGAVSSKTGAKGEPVLDPSPKLKDAVIESRRGT